MKEKSWRRKRTKSLKEKNRSTSPGRDTPLGMGGGAAISTTKTTKGASSPNRPNNPPKKTGEKGREEVFKSNREAELPYSGGNQKGRSMAGGKGDASRSQSRGDYRGTRAGPSRVLILWRPSSVHRLRRGKPTSAESLTQRVEVGEQTRGTEESKKKRTDSLTRKKERPRSEEGGDSLGSSKAPTKRARLSLQKELTRL